MRDIAIFECTPLYVLPTLLEFDDDPVFSVLVNRRIGRRKPSKLSLIMCSFFTSFRRYLTGTTGLESSTLNIQVYRFRQSHLTLGCRAKKASGLLIKKTVHARRGSAHDTGAAGATLDTRNVHAIGLLIVVFVNNTARYM